MGCRPTVKIECAYGNMKAEPEEQCLGQSDRFEGSLECGGNNFRFSFSFLFLFLETDNEGPSVFLCIFGFLCKATKVEEFLNS